MKRAAFFALAAAVAVAAAAAALSHPGARKAPPAIRTAQVIRGDLSVTVSATGAVAATSQVDVRSRATGTVTAVSVQAGDRVTKGQLLAAIDDPDARAALRGAQAQVRQNAAAVASAQAKLATVRAGNRPEQIAQARQAVMQAQANLDLAKTNLASQRELFTQGFIPRATLDQAENQHQVALAQFRSAEQNLQLLQAGPLPSDIAAVEADVRLAQAQLQNAQVQLANAQERYDEGFVRAPISGIVATRAIEVGQTVIGGTATSGTSVFTLANITPLLANVSVDETDIAKVRVGMPVAITVDALPDASFAGVVERIAPAGVVSQNVNQYTVTVEITAPRPALLLGMTVNADFVVAQARNALLVPAEAIRGGDRPFVLLVGARDALTPQPVVTGITNSRLMEIRQGVEEGQRVYLGSVRAPQGGSSPRSPFQPNFQRRGPGGGR